MTDQILTQERLKELLHYNPETGVFTWIAKVAQGVNVGDIAGSTDTYGHIQIKIKYKIYLAHRLAFLYMTGAFPPVHTDHINHNPADNRWLNLRPVTHQENHHNRIISENNTSGINGVSWMKRNKKWRVRINIDGKLVHLGLYRELSDAAKARKEAEIKYGYHENHGQEKV